MDLSTKIEGIEDEIGVNGFGGEQGRREVNINCPSATKFMSINAIFFISLHLDLLFITNYKRPKSNIYTHTMPTLVGKEVGHTGYGTMSTIHFLSTNTRCALGNIQANSSPRNDMEQPAPGAGSVL